MNRKIKDSIFGEMEYKFGWFKREILNLWGNEYEIIIKVIAYNESEINEEQRNSYLRLKSNINEISKNSLELLKEYILKNYENEISENQIFKLVIPKTILFKQNGDFGILCDTSLDEENGFVIVLSPKYEIGIQDIFI
jgi:hypothetical protein